MEQLSLLSSTPLNVIQLKLIASLIHSNQSDPLHALLQKCTLTENEKIFLGRKSCKPF